MLFHVLFFNLHEGEKHARLTHQLNILVSLKSHKLHSWSCLRIFKLEPWVKHALHPLLSPRACPTQIGWMWPTTTPKDHGYLAQDVQKYTFLLGQPPAVSDVSLVLEHFWLYAKLQRFFGRTRNQLQTTFRIFW